MTYSVKIAIDPDDPELTSVSKGGLSWDAAKATLRDFFQLYADDEIPPLRKASAERLVELEAAAPGSFESDIDGYDCLISEEA